MPSGSAHHFFGTSCVAPPPTSGISLQEVCHHRSLTDITQLLLRLLRLLLLLLRVTLLLHPAAAAAAAAAAAVKVHAYAVEEQRVLQCTPANHHTITPRLLQQAEG
jgi:hypothetical protein